MITLKVLAVDDEPGMLSGIERVLDGYRTSVEEIEGEVEFRVETADTGRGALEKIEASSPDILLLDYKLPDIDGLEVLSRLAPESRDMLAIFITAYASIDTAVTATKRGAYDFLAKPFAPADLKYVIRKAATRLLLARRARELEAEKKRVRFEFIRVLGHELKAPISAVAGNLYLLRDRVMGPEVEKYAEVVGRSLKRLEQMRKLIADLLDMTRIESGEKRRSLEEIDLAEAARASLETVGRDAGELGLELELNSPDRLLLRADSTEITMILNNLVSNAVKYNRPGGRVTVGLEKADGEVLIRVSDTGIGMAPEGVEKLFGEFVRLKDRRTREILGTGLGLSILKRVVDLYGGEVEVESELDRGSVFTVRLPEAS